MVLGRKNWIHIGSSQAAPRIAAILVGGGKLWRSKLAVREYLSAVLPGLANVPIRRLTELTPFSVGHAEALIALACCRQLDQSGLVWGLMEYEAGEARWPFSMSKGLKTSSSGARLSNDDTRLVILTACQNRLKGIVA